MNKGKEQKLVSLTEQCLVEYWNKNCEFVLGYCVKDVAWTGAEQTQYMQGVEAVRADFLLHEAVIQPCMIKNGEFMAAQSSGNTCTVVGRYLVETTKEAEYYICAEQRCTFVWEYSGKGPVIRHIHVSNPIGEMKIAEGKHFVNEMGKMARKYMEERIEDILGKRFMVEDLNGVSHVLQSMDILYAEASLRYCIINLQGGKKINAKISITDFEKMADEHFIKVHRSYIVNICYVAMIQMHEIIMSDGTVVPIPEKKYTAVKKLLLQRFEG